LGAVGCVMFIHSWNARQSGMGRRWAFFRKNGMSDGGMFTIALVGCVGSVALAGIAWMAGVAVSRVAAVVMGRSVVALNAAAGTWTSCGVLSHWRASPMKPRMVPLSGWVVPIGVWNRLMLWMTAGVLSGLRMIRRAKGAAGPRSVPGDPGW